VVATLPFRAKQLGIPTPYLLISRPLCFYGYKVVATLPSRAKLLEILTLHLAGNSGFLFLLFWHMICLSWFLDFQTNDFQNVLFYWYRVSISCYLIDTGYQSLDFLLLFWISIYWFLDLVIYDTGYHFLCFDLLRYMVPSYLLVIMVRGIILLLVILRHRVSLYLFLYTVSVYSDIYS